MLGFGKYRYTLLVTVSAAALMVTVERGPLAADIAPVAQDRWWFSVEGQYLLFDGDKAHYSLDGAEGLGDLPQKLKPDDGWGVGAEIGFQPADSPYSFLGRVRYGQSNKEKKSSNFYSEFFGGYRYASSSSSEADHREEHIIADLEIGRDVGLGGLNDGSKVRVFGGLRFAHFKGKGSISSSSYNYSGFGPDTDVASGHAKIERKFTGIGPRIGFDAMMPLSEQFSFDVGAAGAVLFGKQKFEASGNYSYSGFSEDINEKRSKFVAVPNLEASAAFSWLITENAKFSLGYRVDSYFDVYDNGDVFGDRDEGDRIIHGPFIKLTIGSGGDGG